MNAIHKALVISEFEKQLNMDLANSANFRFIFIGLSVGLDGVERLTFHCEPYSNRHFDKEASCLFDVNVNELSVLRCRNHKNINESVLNEAGNELCKILGCIKYVGI